ncbi:hypothetical protein E0Z10_g2933 [Xylaria hypoxylon]|uniref:BIR-domain-containing protein n=1 Tax=Xylaria hypoxylon TaxID=37992 RepID=A0A4Z0Z8Y3_9PEZI|nr:hypothetical protein E0Z10_g2933 [Xylaria hypoxylon]
MESDEMSDRYYTYDGRLASFQSAQPVARRASTSKGKVPKALSWPHRRLNPEIFANAGFYFAPNPHFPDNTICFLCCKNVDTWEEDDNPFEEHLRLSPHCGWAIVAGIETGLGDYALDDPTSPEMIAARKATFGDRWPHDGKRGWKCKTKQLVDAGWKYTPTMDSDDMATCAYCQLALDGWEPKDNPMDEHYRRSPECPFFVLINQYKSAAPAKKKARGKAARSSKASRLSTQSIATAASDVTSLLEHPADHDDSVLTTTSVMTQGGTKRPRAKKATTLKGKKSRAKKEEAVEVLEDPPEDAHPEDEGVLPQEEEPLQTETEKVPRKPARGRKRTSAAVEDSVLTTAEAPAPKKRATRGKLVSAKADQPGTDYAMFDPVPPEIDDAAVDVELKALEAEMEVEPAETLHVPKKGRQAGTRKASKQTTKKTKTKAPVEPMPEPEPTVEQSMDELAEGHDMSIMSNATIVRTSISSTSAPKKRGRPSKKLVPVQVEAEPEPAARSSPEPEAGVERVDFAEPRPAPTVSQQAAMSQVNKKYASSRDKSLPPPPPASEDMQRPVTPEPMISPAPAAKQANVSPPQSPQSSDAENQPPSSKPSNTAKSTRIALAPIATTPIRSSPSKRNIISGLQSTHAWTAVDVDMIFDELDKGNTLSTGRFLKNGMDLTSPEKKMTVEQWIYHNAEQAENQLKHECEAIVMAFEQEGSRAMQALEGVVVE